MDTSELKKIKGGLSFFIESKKGSGLPSYTFEEAVMYLGYEKAVKTCVSYLKCAYNKYRDCTLTRDYLEHHFDAYKFTFKDRNTRKVILEVVVTPDGKICDTEVMYRDLEVQFEVKYPKSIKTYRKAVIADEASAIREIKSVLKEYIHD